jgi:hypothetical protein
MTTTTAAYWMNSNGMILCADHAGHSLQSAIEAKPNASRHSTDSDKWTRVTDESISILLEPLKVHGFTHLCESRKH